MIKKIYILVILIAFNFFKLSAQSEILSKKDSLFVAVNIEKSKKYIEKDIDSSLFYLNILDNFLKKKKLQKLRVNILLRKGNGYLAKGFNEKALKLFIEASEISNIIDFKRGKALSAISIANIYVETQEYEKVIELFKNFKLEYKVIDSSEIEFEAASTILNNEGIAYENLKIFDKAGISYLAAIEFAKKIQNPYYLATAKSNFSSLKQKQNLYKESLSLQFEALEIRKKNNLNFGITQSLGNLAQIYLELKDTIKAKKYFIEGLNEAKKVKSVKYIKQYSTELKDIYYSQVDFKKAFEMQELEMQSVSELLNKESIKEEARLKAIYEIGFENKIKEKEQKLKELILISLMGILIFSIIIVTILFLLQKSRAKQSIIRNESIKKEKIILQKDLDLKNKKIVSNLMYLLQKNEMITNLLEQLVDLRKESKGETEKIVNQIIQNLRINAKDESWDEFETYFQDVHIDFYKKLNSYNLTPNELKLAAFIKLNLSSKEISSITGQTVRTINVARYRMRKKLNITNSDMNLLTFLSKI